MFIKIKILFGALIFFSTWAFAGGVVSVSNCEKFDLKKFLRPKQKLSRTELKAIEDYTYCGYQKLNRCLRAGESSLEKAGLDMQFKILNSGLKKCERHESDIPLVRGLKMPENEIKEALKPGHILIQKSFVSTSATAEIADRFTDNVQLVIVNPVTARDISSISTYEEEDERIFLPGTKFQTIHAEQYKRPDGSDLTYLCVRELFTRSMQDDFFEEFLIKAEVSRE